MNKYIAIIQTGKPIDTVLNKYADFDALFYNQMQLDASQFKTFNVFETLKFPEIKSLAGIIITGSPSMVTDKEDWSEKTIEWLKQFIELEIPILGVCYGHQMLARALGGEVNWNPNGRQIGTIQMQLTDAAHSDSLLSAVIENKQNAIKFNATHLQSVTLLPKDVILLGSTKLDPNHCFRYKNHIWGAQFHPEFNVQIIQEYLHVRSEKINDEGLDINQLLINVDDNDNGQKLLLKFRDLCFNS